MDPKTAPKKIRKSEEASQGLQKCAQTLKGSIHYAPRIPADPLIRSVGLRSATKLSRRPHVVSTRCRSLGPKGTQGTPPPIKPHPRGGQGSQGPEGPKGPFGGMGPWGPLGLFRSHSAWKAISSGGLFRKKSRGRPWARNCPLGGLGTEIVQNGTN